MEPEKTTLLELCRKYGSDKEVAHGYISGLYEELFAPLRDKPLRMMEIGVFGGASIHMWAEYFTNPDFRVEGVDLTPREIYETGGSYTFEKPGGTRAITLDVRPLPWDTDKVAYSQADAYSDDWLDPLYESDEEFDIIIDDGPHTEEAQLAFPELYWPLVAPGGYLILEDIPTFERADRLRAWRTPTRTLDKSYSRAPDSRIFVWQKPMEPWCTCNNEHECEGHRA